MFSWFEFEKKGIFYQRTIFLALWLKLDLNFAIRLNLLPVASSNVCVAVNMLCIVLSFNGLL